MGVQGNSGKSWDVCYEIPWGFYFELRGFYLGKLPATGLKIGSTSDRLTEGWPAGRSIGGDASQRLPQVSSEGGAGLESPANQLSGSEHPRDSA